MSDLFAIVWVNRGVRALVLAFFAYSFMGMRLSAWFNPTLYDQEYEATYQWLFMIPGYRGLIESIPKELGLIVFMCVGWSMLLVGMRLANFAYAICFLFMGVFYLVIMNGLLGLMLGNVLIGVMSNKTGEFLVWYTPECLLYSLLIFLFLRYKVDLSKWGFRFTWGRSNRLQKASI